MSSGQVSKKTIFITGAGSGIGRASAELFCRSGWYAGLYDVNEEAVLSLHRELGADVSCAGSLDVADPADVKVAIDHFLQNTGGKMHVLFNNAGILRTGPFEEIPLDDHHRTIDVNARGVLNCTYQALPALKATPGAKVINMCSSSALFGSPDHVTYSSTKFWVRGFTEALDVEWSRFGIRVSDVMPPYVATPMIENARKIQAMRNLGVGMTPERVAKTVWKAAHKNKIHWTVGGQSLMLYVGARLLPVRLVRLIAKKTTGY